MGVRVLTLDHGQGTPLRGFPSRPQQPLLHLGDQSCEVLRVGLHDFVEFGEFARTEEDFRQAELEIGIAKIQRFEQALAEETRLEPGQFRRQVRFVHGVQLGELRAGWKALLHQIQHRNHTWMKDR